MEKNHNHHVEKLLAAFNSENEGSHFINDPIKIKQLAYLCLSIGFDLGFKYDTKSEYLKPVTMFDSIGIEIRHFNSITEAAAYFGVNEYSILKVLNTGMLYAGFQWKEKGKHFFKKI